MQVTICICSYLSCFSKAIIHICPLIIAFCRCCQVFLCITNSCNSFELHLCMFFSLSAVFKTMLTSAQPSFYATDAKYVYLFLAGTSPKNALYFFLCLCSAYLLSAIYFTSVFFITFFKI